ncbi:hypothetical protein C4577_07965 [Candidatus Parcubacteria bacterium]|nr:MAG: hypothetical protein C4577_07965 [Candidatus Parcubacteria bacterium]
MTNLRYYKGAIWTNHALERLDQRGLTQDLAAQAFNRPDNSIQGKKPGTIEFQKRVGKSLITIISKKNEKNEWIILSCWIDPPLPGSIDILKQEQYKKYQKAGFWKRLFISFKNQLGF